LDTGPGSKFGFSRPCPHYSMIVDRTQSDILWSGSACVAVYLRYQSASCPLDINEIACLARAAGYFTCLPVGEAYPGRRSVSFCVLCTERENQYLVGWEVREIARLVVYPVMPVVNATVLAAIIFLAAVTVCSLCFLIILHAAFKSYKMLSVHKLCQSWS
jgi:hypothetical protein